MSEKGSKGLREMTTASLAALFVMIGFCMFMGFKWERLDAAMAEGVR